MPSVSKIPRNINKYAIKCAYEIRNKTVEYGKGLDFEFDEIVKESRFIKGTAIKVSYDFEKHAKDVFIHNHPTEPTNCRILSFGDIGTAILKDVKKIFASTEDGYTSLDLTTVKKSVSKNDMYYWIIGRKTAWEHKELLPKSTDGNSLESIKKAYYETIKDFAKFSGATLSDVKWKDCKYLNKAKKEPPFQPLINFIKKLMPNSIF